MTMNQYTTHNLDIQRKKRRGRRNRDPVWDVLNKELVDHVKAQKWGLV